MMKKLPERQGWCALRTAGIAALVMSAASCQMVLGIEDTTVVQADAALGVSDAAPGASDAAPGTPDAALPRDFTVRGMALGVFEPLSLQLVHPGGSEFLTVSNNGPFAFEARLEAGAAYVVNFTGTPPCVLESESGTIAGADPEVFLACEGAPLLEDLVLSGPMASDVSVSLARTEYEADVPLLQESVTLTPVVRWPGATVIIAGTVVASGMPGPLLPLAPGANEVKVEVSQSGQQRTYRVTIHRAAELAQYAYGKASNTGVADELGYSVALAGDTLAVGAPYEDSVATGVDGNQANNSAFGSGAVYVFRRTGSTWAQEAYLKASNTGPDDNFGMRVALSGDTLAVGAYLEDSAATGVGGNQADNSAAGSGAVYVFRRTGSTWAQEAYVKASNTGAGDHFGGSMALSGDTLAVGAYGEASAATGVGGNQADNSAFGSGAVYVFRRTGTNWIQEAYVKASNTGAGDHFGESVALSGDMLAVGAYGEGSAATGVGGNQADNGAAGSGAVYVFRRTGTNWIQEAYVKASNTGAGDYFGESVALSGDMLAVGAYGEGSAATGVGGNQADNSAAGSGAVYMFRRTGSTWAQEAYVKASNTDTYDNFGVSVALSGDTLAVGAYLEDSAATGVGGNQADNNASNSGAVYIFH